MKGNENPWELNSVSASLLGIKIMNKQTISHLSSDPLCSCIITLYTLILLYFPRALKFFLSPVLILTALLLLFLLRLGAVQRLHREDPETNATQENVESKEKEITSDLDEAKKSVFLGHVDKWVACQAESGSDPNPIPYFEESFVGWDVRAPLEVIYEDYEGEDEEGGDEEKLEGLNRSLGWERYPSLSMYYPETDSDSSSDDGFTMAGGWDSPESVCFRWEEEDKAGLLIEIDIDSNDKKDCGLGSGLGLGFQVEEDNLIEIDISPPRNDAFCGLV